MGAAERIAKRLARELASNGSITRAEAEQRAEAEAEQIPEAQRRAFLRQWRLSYDAHASRRAFEAILREADKWK